MKNHNHSGQIQYNVCGAIISINPVALEQMKVFLATLPGCNILASDLRGKIAVTVEDIDHTSAYDQLGMIKEYPLVLSLDLVNHYFE